ncbi:hypothetical protein SAMN04487820_102284 [Actinopolyspora mzabensis]|uniref:Uncharacterized protein n=1 Tax=Actinopolyspora mzabensis TaxID=995066 RepID=A0A1G8WY87_ACTMZ|nr:hypothetical protein [Actinopolyspora mzabensis]SDJ83174.1 hypothetical protein SAMN04487820_102284 [Actinopolyspora mzabensis]
MDGSLDVRKFLALQDRASPRSAAAAVPAQRDGDSGGLSPEQLHRARLAVARGARDRADCRMLLAMLGLTDDDNEEATRED